MAPVAGGITDAQKDGLILPLRFFKSLIAPGIPVDGIAGMLKEIRAFLINQSVQFPVFLIRGVGLQLKNYFR
jgi:hypothetical protein